jgi:hypothetical protein
MIVVKEIVKNHINFVYWQRYKDSIYIISNNGNLYNTKTNYIIKGYKNMDII